MRPGVAPDERQAAVLLHVVLRVLEEAGVTEQYAMVPASVLFAGLPPQAVALFALIDWHAGKKGTCRVSRARLGQELGGRSHDAVTRSLALLKDAGVIEVHQQKNAVSTYTVVHRVRRNADLGVRKNASGGTQKRRTEPELLNQPEGGCAKCDNTKRVWVDPRTVIDCPECSSPKLRSVS